MNGYQYQLSKINPSTGKEEFFLEGGQPKTASYVAVDVPTGEWRVYVMSKEGPLFFNQVFPFSLLGTLLSITAGFFAWHFTRQPEALKRRVQEIATAMQQLQKANTESLQHANRLYHFISRINHLMVHAKDDRDLYAEVCQVAFEIGQYKFAWIGIIDREQKKVIPVSCAGDDKGYLPKIAPISLEENENEPPVKRMVRTGTYVYCNDTSTETHMKPWATLASEHGFKSVILIPICRAGEIVASFSLYADVTDAFYEEEIKLLLETTSNISFTLDSLNNQRLRRYAEALMQEEKTLSDSVINSLPGIFYLCNRDGRFIRWNRNMEIVSGLSSDEMLHVHPLDFFRGHAKDLLRKKIDEVFENGHAEVTAEFFSKRKGDVIPYYINGRKVSLKGEDYLIGMGLDISERVKAEQALLERAEEIERLSTHLQNVREEERSRIALEIHDVLGQQLTALKMDTSWIKKKAIGDNSLHERLSGMLVLIDDTIKTIRRISSELRPGILDDLGLIAALEWQGGEFQKNTGIQFVFETNVQDVDLPSDCTINIFRIFQEALTNIARHAQATVAKVVFNKSEHELNVQIIDNGKGVELPIGTDKKSLGFVSMKERARQLEGEISFENVLPHGTVVKLKIPFPRVN